MLHPVPFSSGRVCLVWAIWFVRIFPQQQSLRDHFRKEPGAQTNGIAA
jgi:hypothetical protein